MRNLLVAGASKGLGYSLAESLGQDYDTTYMLSRTEPVKLKNINTKWLDVDLSLPSKVSEKVSPEIKDMPVDTLIYNAGIWETLSFAETTEKELIDIINVNLTSAITLVKSLHDNLLKGKGNIILIGSTCGLENEGASCVGYVSGKFGLRGMAYSLREYFRGSDVRVTVLNPGSMATDYSLKESSEALEHYENRRMPVSDITEIVRCLLKLSKATTIKELTIPSTLDIDV